MYENYCRIRDAMGYKDADVVKGTGITKSTFSDWKSGRSNPKNEKLIKIADFLGVSIESLMVRAEDSDKKEPQLKPKDEKDIKNILANTEQLLKQPGLMFEGKPASQESIDSILSAMQIGMEMAKKKNKELYTPKKYKEEQ